MNAETDSCFSLFALIFKPLKHTNNKWTLVPDIFHALNLAAAYQVTLSDFQNPG